jgi:hypothetical protein
MPIESPGPILVHGEWDDSQQMSLALRATGANIPALTQYATSGVYLLKFVLNDFACFAIQMPHGYQEGSPLSPHFHWFGSTVSANVVKWQLTYQWVNWEGGVMSSTTPTVLTCTQAEDGIGKLRMVETTDIVGTGMKISSLLLGTVKRVTNAATDYTGDVFLAAFDVHFLRQTHGSRSEGVK